MSLRKSVEPLPDDRGRLGRQLAMALAAPPAWLGASVAESKLEAHQREALTRTFDRAIAWVPQPSASDSTTARFAPTIVVERLDQYAYPEECDRFGEVYLAGTL